MKTKKMKIYSTRLLVLVFILQCIFITTSMPILAESTTTTPYKYRILEIQPSRTFLLGNQTKIDNTFSNFFTATSNIKVDTMSVVEFNGKIDELNGKYDLIIIGTEGNAYWNETAIKPSYVYNRVKNPQVGVNGNSVGYTEYYPANDLTQLKADKIQEMIDSGQLVVFDEDIFKKMNFNASFTDSDSSYKLKTVSQSVSIRNTKLYKTFSDDYINGKIVATGNILDWVNKNLGNKKTVATYKATGGATMGPETYLLRDQITITSAPKAYATGQAETSGKIEVKFKVNTLSAIEGPMLAYLYVDINADGIFKSSDYLIDAKKDVNGDGTFNTKDSALLRNQDEILAECFITPGDGNAEYTLSYTMPESFTGYVQWKLEVEATGSNFKSYELGDTLFKAQEVNVRVLQIKPDPAIGTKADTNFRMSTDMAQSILKKTGEYNITVTERNVTQFQNLYVANPNYTLNSQYDMVIIGFQDSFAKNDVSNPLALQDLKNFIATGQGVMFTHDTINLDYFGSDSRTGSSGKYNLTYAFRDLVGQNIYNYEKIDNNDSSKSIGFSLPTLFRFNYNNQEVTKAYMFNEAQITNYPNKLGSITVASTHYQWYQLDLEDIDGDGYQDVVPWYTLMNTGSVSIMNQYDPANYYYTYSKGSITYSGTGHSSPSGLEEKNLFVNTIIKATRGANHAPTFTTTGVQPLPAEQEYNIAQNTLDFTIKPEDIDLQDEYFNGEIYISTDSNFATGKTVKVKSYSSSANDVTDRLVRGNDNPVSINIKNNSDLSSLSIGTTKEPFYMKVVVSDEKGAKSEKAFKFNPVDLPSFKVTGNSITALVGDLVQLKLHTMPVIPSIMASGINISNISIHNKFKAYNTTTSAYDLSTAFGVNNDFDFKAVTVANQPTPTVTTNVDTQPIGDTIGLGGIPSIYFKSGNQAQAYMEQNYTNKYTEKIYSISFIPQKEGNYQVSSGYTYNVSSKSSPDSANVDSGVRIWKGGLELMVVDSRSVPIKNATLQLQKKNSSGTWVDFPLTEPPKTNDNGLFNTNNFTKGLTSGKYRFVFPEVVVSGKVKYTRTISQEFDLNGSEEKFAKQSGKMYILEANAIGDLKISMTSDYDAMAVLKASSTLYNEGNSFFTTISALGDVLHPYKLVLEFETNAQITKFDIPIESGGELFTYEVESATFSSPILSEVAGAPIVYADTVIDNSKFSVPLDVANQMSNLRFEDPLGSLQSKTKVKIILKLIPPKTSGVIVIKNNVGTPFKAGGTVTIDTKQPTIIDYEMHNKYSGVITMNHDMIGPVITVIKPKVFSSDKTIRVTAEDVSSTMSGLKYLELDAPEAMDFLSNDPLKAADKSEVELKIKTSGTSLPLDPANPKKASGTHEMRLMETSYYGYYAVDTAGNETFKVEKIQKSVLQDLL